MVASKPPRPHPTLRGDKARDTTRSSCANPLAHIVQRDSVPQRAVGNIAHALLDRTPRPIRVQSLAQWLYDDGEAPTHEETTMGWGDENWGQMVWGGGGIQVPMASELAVGALVLSLLLIGRHLIMRRSVRSGAKR